MKRSWGEINAFTEGSNSRGCRRAIVAQLMLLVAGACACSSADEIEGFGTRTQALGDEIGDEIVLDGRLFIRRTALGDKELKEITSPKLWEPPETIDKRAQLLRIVTLIPGAGEYVEAEPNYEQAAISLESEEEELWVAADSGPGTIDKSVSTNGDQRFAPGDPDEHSYLAFSEAGGSGVSIVDGFRVYTAAHVVYDNAKSPDPDGWVCSDGSTSTDGGCPGSSLTRWRFGGRIVGGSPVWSTGWKSGIPAVTVGWQTLAAGASNTEAAKWDYGRALFSSSLGVISLGAVTNASQATLRANQLNQEGYPYLFTCPALSIGTSNAASGNCPASGSQGVVQLRPTNLVRPLTGAQMFQTRANDPNCTVGTYYIRTGTLDITSGHSGGPLWLHIDATIHRYVAGVAVSTAQGSTNTHFNRLNTDVKNFLGF